MRLLLDTNALLWQLGIADSGSLGEQAVALMKEADELCVSSISIAEMQIKAMLGKLGAPADCSSAISAAGDSLLPFLPSMADAIPLFPELKRHDPFDRMILAHAKVENLTLVTSDTILLGLGLGYVIDARL